MKIVTYNIQYSLGTDGRYDLRRIADTVADADIIALQEVERNWPRTGMTDQPAELAAMLEGRYWAFGPEYDFDASGDDGPAGGRRAQHGNMLLSRWPLQSVRNLMLPFTASPSHDTGPSGALEGIVTIEGRPLRLYSLHLGHLSKRDRLQQID